MTDRRKRLLFLGILLVGVFVFFAIMRFQPENAFDAGARDISRALIIALILGRLGYEWSLLVPSKNNLKKDRYRHFLLPIAILAMFTFFILLPDYGPYAAFYDAARDEIFTPTIILVLSSIVFLHVVSCFYSDSIGSSWFVALAGVSYITLGSIGFYISVVGLGMGTTVFLFCVIFVADSVGYLAGQYWGGKKLCPATSSGKTWGGLLFAFASVFLLYHLGKAFFERNTPYWWLIFAMVLFSILGDLYTSLLRKRIGLKPVADFIPSYGSLLDRLDGHLMAFSFLAAFLIISHLLGF